MCSGFENLLCCDDICGNPFMEESPRTFYRTSDDSVSSSCPLFPTDKESLLTLLSRETKFVVGDEYICRLTSDGCIRAARLNAVRWMIKAGFHFNFHAGTVSSAVKCFDRFLQRNLDKMQPLKPWIMDLISVGCFSVAAKQHEVYAPPLQEMQIGGLKYRFASSAIQRMELLILTTLEWRMNSVTPFCYTDLMLSCLGVPRDIQESLSTRITELALQTLQGIEFLKCRSSVLAASCLWLTLEELVPVQADSYRLRLRDLISVDEQQVQRYYKIIEALPVDPLVQPMPSPTSAAEAEHENGAPDISRHITVNKMAKPFIRKRAASGETLGLSAHSTSVKRTKLHARDSS